MTQRRLPGQDLVHDHPEAELKSWSQNLDQDGANQDDEAPAAFRVVVLKDSGDAKLPDGLGQPDVVGLSLDGL